MKPPKPTWKSRALTAEKELENKIVHFQGKLVDEEVKKQLAARAPIEKIIERKVLPLWTQVLMGICMGGWIGVTFALHTWIVSNREPIIQYKYVEGHTVYRPDQIVNSKLVACKDSWREDEAELKVLRRKLKDKNEGTVFVP